MSVGKGLLLFLSGAAAAGAVGLLRRIREARRIRREAQTHAPVERLEGRAEIPTLRPVPARLSPLEEARRALLTEGKGARILLAGPQACGKTYLARAFSAHSGLPALFVRAAALPGGSPALTEERIHDLAARAERVAPAILVLDGLEACAGEAALQGALCAALASRPGLLIIGTSREEAERGGLPFETVIPLDGQREEATG